MIEEIKEFECRICKKKYTNFTKGLLSHILRAHGMSESVYLNYSKKTRAQRHVFSSARSKETSLESTEDEVLVVVNKSKYLSKRRKLKCIEGHYRDAFNNLSDKKSTLFYIVVFSDKIKIGIHSYHTPFSIGLSWTDFKNYRYKEVLDCHVFISESNSSAIEIEYYIKKEYISKTVLGFEWFPLSLLEEFLSIPIDFKLNKII